MTQAAAVEVAEEETKRYGNKNSDGKDQNDYYDTRLDILNRRRRMRSFTAAIIVGGDSSSHDAI